MKENADIKSIILHIFGELEGINKRHPSETDPVMRDMMVNSVIKREDDLRHYGEYHTKVFAQMIADGNLPPHYIMYLSSDKYKIHPIRKEAIPVLLSSEINDVISHTEWHIRCAKSFGQGDTTLYSKLKQWLNR